MSESSIRLERYADEEVRAAIEELFGYPSFINGMKAFLPEALSTLILQAKSQIQNAFDFQKQIIAPFLKLIEKISITELTQTGLHQLDPQQSYLFISNHRDIVLDSALLNLLLFEQGFPTSQIAIGDNLMLHRNAELLFRLNKSFVVRRNGTARELYEHSLALSNYIQQTITAKKDSVWIAQREGRAKDGDDRTQVGLLTMLSLSGRQDLPAHFGALNIVPVAIAYEFDPCAGLKTQEYLQKVLEQNPAKSFQKDLENILQGLKGPKGRVHFHFGTPLNDQDMAAMGAVVGGKKQLEWLATRIDDAIHRHYRLLPINYVAADALTPATPRFANHYSSAEREAGLAYFEQQLKAFPVAEQELARNYLLRMYANPVFNQVALAS